MNADGPTRMERPQEIHDYRLIRCIDSGSFGEVWLARTKATERYRAVKIVYYDRLPNARAYDLEFAGLKRFEEISREHAGFVDILHISRDDEARCFYYVMELADDLENGSQIDEATYQPRTLAKELAHHGRLSPAACVTIGLALAEALAELHRQALVHRDIKPSNIMYVRGTPRVADIGLVTEASLEPRTLVGTPEYMDLAVQGTAQGDLYSLGMLLYVVATGRRPTEFPADPDKLSQIEDPEAFRDLAAIYRKACHSDRTQRFQSAEEIRQQLALLRAGRSVRRLERLEQFAATAKHSLMAGLLLCFLASFGIYQWTQKQHQAAELRQRDVGSFVAYGTRAMEDLDVLGALPWFAEAYRLDQGNPAALETHRLRLASMLQHSPTIIQMWFNERGLSLAAFAGQENQLLAPATNGRWGILDLTSGRPIYPPFGTGSDGESAAISPAAGLAITANETASLRLWDLKSGQVLRQLHFTNALTGAALSPDGRWAAAAAEDNRVVIWETRDEQPRFVLAGHTNGILHLGFSPSAQWLLTTGTDNQAIVWEVGTGRCLRTFTRHRNWVYHGAFSPDERSVATASFDRSVRLWELETGQELLPALGNNDGVFSVEFSADGHRLVTAELDFAVRLYDAESGELLRLLRHDTKPVYAAFSPTGRHVVTVTHDGTIRVWDLRQDGLAIGAGPLAYNRDGTRSAWETNGLVQVLDSATGQSLSQIPLDQHHPVESQFSAAGGRLLLVTAPGAGDTNRLTATVWNCADATPVTAPIALPTAPTQRRLSPAGNRLAVFGDGRLTVHDLAAGRPLLTLTQAVERVAFDPTGQHLAVGVDRSVELWDLAAGRPLPVGPWVHHAKVQSIEWSADGRWVGTACFDNTFYHEAGLVHDASTGQLAMPPLPHRDGVCFVGFSPDGQKVITCGEDFTAVLWAAGTGHRLVGPLRHKHQVVHAAFSEDGRWVATACLDRTARVWDVQSGEPLTPPLRHHRGVLRVQLVNHGQLLFTQTADGRTHLWRLPRELRPAEDVVLVAGLLSAQPSRSASLLAPQSKHALRQTWELLRSKYPEDFSFAPR